MATVAIETVEVWFQGGIRNGRRLEGKRALKVYQMTEGAPIGARFLACRLLQQEITAGRRKGSNERLFCKFPYSERYEIVDRRVMGRTITLRAKRVL